MIEGVQHSESVVKLTIQDRLVKALVQGSEFPSEYEAPGHLQRDDFSSRILVTEVTVASLQGKASVW